jgi:hypothetical protein
MLEIELRATGVAQVQTRLARMVTAVGPAVDAVTERGAYRLRDYIQEEIRRQGLVETGAYLNSWSVVPLGRGRWAVVSDAPQSDRLEYGFVAVDSLGRSYADPPRAHRRPAIDRATEKYRDDLAKVIPLLWHR